MRPRVGTVPESRGSLLAVLYRTLGVDVPSGPFGECRIYRFQGKASRLFREIAEKVLERVFQVRESRFEKTFGPFFENVRLSDLSESGVFEGKSANHRRLMRRVPRERCRNPRQERDFLEPFGEGIRKGVPVENFSDFRNGEMLPVRSEQAFRNLFEFSVPGEPVGNERCDHGDRRAVHGRSDVFEIEESDGLSTELREVFANSRRVETPSGRQGFGGFF